MTLQSHGRGPGAGLEVERWLYDRECGLNRNAGSLHPTLFSSIKCVRAWNPADTVKHTHHGGIFNFDFSNDGALLVAACERKSLLMFDPLNGKLITAKNQAHEDCVNCVRFLDNRTFVTCSDDTTVCLWDARFLKQKVRTLRGHSNWVKNIEFDRNSGLLVTSGFDGSIYAWDINSYATDPDANFTRLFHTNGLMRSKLTPDGTRLVIATAGGYLMVVHDLDLSALREDLHGFKPNMYRLMQMSKSPIHHGFLFNHVFSRQRNRVELISDFPAENDAEMIASLEVHPQGWCVVSRNTSSDESSEWTCIHDIQTGQARPQENDSSGTQTTNQLPVPSVSLNTSASEASPQRVNQEGADGREPSEETWSEPGSSNPSRSNSPSFVLSLSINDSIVSALGQSTPSSGSVSGTSSLSAGDDLESATHGEASAGGDQNVNQANSNSTSTGSPPTRLSRAVFTTNSPSPRRQAVSDPRSPRPASEESGDDHAAPRAQVSITSPGNPRVHIGESMTFIIRSSSEIPERTLRVLSHHPGPHGNNPHPKIHENCPHLTHYIQEPNVGRGFIKEVCFSSDGRLICSPFGFGVRLLAFNPGCRELCDCVPQQPLKLREVTSNMSHSSVVLTTKFSPTHCLLVSGCLNGKVDFHQPLL